MLDEKSIWRVGDFLTRGAEEHGVLQVDEAEPLSARPYTARCWVGRGTDDDSKGGHPNLRKRHWPGHLPVSVSGSKGPLATSEQAQAAAAEWAYIIFCDLYREDPLERDDEGYWGLTIKVHSVM